jgi:hypothetical protein
MKWLAPQDQISTLVSPSRRSADVKLGAAIDWLSHSSIRARGA